MFFFFNVYSQNNGTYAMRGCLIHIFCTWERNWLLIIICYIFDVEQVPEQFSKREDMKGQIVPISNNHKFWFMDCLAMHEYRPVCHFQCTIRLFHPSVQILISSKYLYSAYWWFYLLCPALVGSTLCAFDTLFYNKKKRLFQKS